MEVKPQRHAKWAFRTRNAKGKKERGRKKQSSRTRKRKQYVHADDSCATLCVPRPNVLVRSLPTSPLSLFSLSLSLSSRALHMLSKSTHQTPAAEFPPERCASYPKIQIPILRPENSNQLGRSACHFDTPDNSRTAGPNSMSRQFQPTGWSCPPFWNPGRYQNSRSQCLVLMSDFFWDNFWQFFPQNNWIFSFGIFFFQCKFNYLFYGKFFSRFSILQNWGKKKPCIFCVAKISPKCGK